MFQQLEEIQSIGLKLRVLNLRGLLMVQLISKVQTLNTYPFGAGRGGCVRALCLAYLTLRCLLLVYFTTLIVRKYDLCLIPIIRRL